MRAFRDGKFRVCEDASANASRVCAIVRAARGLGSAANATFIRAATLCCSLPDFDDARLLKGMAICPEKLLPFAGVDATLTMFEDIYNLRQRTLFPLRVAVTNAVKKARDQDPARIAARQKKLADCAARVVAFVAERRAPTSVLTASRALKISYRIITEAARAAGLYVVKPGGYITVIVQ